MGQRINKQMMATTVAIILFLQYSAQAQPKFNNGEYYYARSFFFAGALDSVLFFKEFKGDTVIYWTTRSAAPHTKKSFKKIQRDSRFGTELQRGPTLNDGKVIVNELGPVEFLIRNDSLFQRTQLYKISEDSINKLVAYRSQHQSDNADEQTIKILEANTQYGFAFIFNVNVFETNLSVVVNEPLTECKNRLTLKSKWKVENTIYSLVEIRNPCGFDGGNIWNLIISNNLDIVGFGGYLNSIGRALNNDNKILDIRSEGDD